MGAAFDEGLVRQWVGWCQAIAAQYQSRRLADLQGEVEKLIGQAEAQARALRGDGSNFLTLIQFQLERRAAAEAAADPFMPAKPADSARATAFREFAAAFGLAAERMQQQAA
jgi:hypothetical protein